MKVLTTTGLTELIQLIKDNYTESSDLATVATSGNYNDLSNKPTISDLVDTTQLSAINSGITSTAVTQIGTNTSDITTINNKIPSAATSSNQLADKDFVNSTVTTLLARYITSSAGGDSFATHAALAAGPYYLDGTAVTTSDLHTNDYAMIMEDETHDNKPARYIWSGSQWSFQYVLNNTTFTQAQVDALNSTITSNLVSDYNTHIADTNIHVTATDKSNWNAKQAAITGAATTITTNNLTASRVLVSNSSGKIAASSSVTTTELGYLDGVTSSVQTQLNNKQATLVSGTNIKTINSTSLLGSGDISIPALPSQSGNTGKFLTTDGTNASWATVDVLPTQSGQSGKYLTTNGTSASWSSLATVATSGDYNDISNKPKFNGIELGSSSKYFYGTSNSLDDAVIKEVEISTITELSAGQIIIVQPAITSTVADSELQLNEFDSYPMLYNNTAITVDTAGIVWTANIPAFWLFDGTSWVFLGHGLDKDTTYTALSQTYSNAKLKAGTGSYSISRYSLIAEKPNGTWEKITNTGSDYSTATNKTVNTSGFVLGQIKYYSATANVASGVNVGMNTVYEKVNEIDMRYSTNCGTTPGWTDGKYIYLVGTVGADGLFYLNSTTWWTQTLPSTNDGKIYVQIGRANLGTNAYKCGLDEDHPAFYHDGTGIKEYKVADNKQDLLVSGTNIKTINNNSILGSGNLDIDALPSQSGNNGKFLTTNGSDASWATLATVATSGSYNDLDDKPTIPTTTSSITSGSTAALTSGGAYTNLVTKVEAGDTANKIKVTKAGSPSTITIDNVANATTASKLGSNTIGGTTQPIYLNAGTPTVLDYTIEKSVPADALFTDHTYSNGAGLNLSGSTFSAKCDTTTISTNGSSQLQAIGVIDKKTSSAVYTWKGTKAEYEALSTYNNNWLYYITDDSLLPGETYYTKSQIDAMLADNHVIIHDTAKLILRDTNTNADVTVDPSTNHNGGLVQFQDKNSNTSGYLYTAYCSNGNIEQVLESDRMIDGSVVSASIKVGVDSEGVAYTNVPTPATSNAINNSNIATVGWINDSTKSTGIVHIEGAETITGDKECTGIIEFSGETSFGGATEFTNNPVFVVNASNKPLSIQNTNDNQMLLPEETIGTEIDICDANSEVTGGIAHYHQADGTTITQLTTRQQAGVNYGTISVSIDQNGNAWCNLPTDTYGTNFHGTSTHALYADLAENYESDQKYPAGTLIRFGGEKDITAATINCNGVISDKPGYVLDADLKNSLPVALVGKTPIRVVGKVKKFDRVVLSSTPGVATVQVTSDQKVIGIALEGSDVNEEKLVMCVTKFNLD